MPRTYSGEHVRIWEAAHGPVPKGYEIHHKNKDKKDNRLENLELLTVKEHWQRHHAERGADWHSKGGKASWARRVLVDLTCVVCGEAFQSKVPGAECCSPVCRDRRFTEQRRGGQWVDRTCCLCGKEFQIRRSRLKSPNGGRYCSASCRNNWGRADVLPQDA